MKISKKRASKVLMILILAMYINETVLITLNWYLDWLAYVKYSGSEDQAAAMFIPSEETPLIVLNMIGVSYILRTIRLGIADSIMVICLISCLFCDSNQLLRSGAVGSSAVVVGKQQAFHSS